VISESAATCIANSVARSNIGHIHLVDQTVADLWNEPYLKFNTSSLGYHFPILEEKLGPNRPLYSHVFFKDIDILFGSFDTDVIISYTACYKLQLIHGDSDLVFDGQEVIYDEVRMVTSAKAYAENDKIFITLLKHKMIIDSQYGQSTQPLRNGMNLTENEYRDFISSFGFF